MQTKSLRFSRSCRVWASRRHGWGHIERDLAETDQADGLTRAADAHQRQGLLLLEMPGARVPIGLYPSVRQADEHSHRQSAGGQAYATADCGAGALALQIGRVGGK